MGSSRDGSYEKGSPADFAHQAVTKIQTYANSDDPEETLIGLNAFLFIFIIGFVIASWLSSAETIFSLTFLAVLVVSLLFGAVLSLAYLPVIETVSNFGSGNLNGLRFAILLEFFAFTSVFAGLLLDVQALVRIAFLLVIVQVFIPLAGDVLPMLDPEPVTDTEDTGLWNTLGRLNSLIGVGTFLLNLLLFAFEYVR